MHSSRSTIFHLPIGRGCPVQCTWCSGSSLPQETITGRREVTFRGVEYVLRSIKEALSYGYQTFHISFDPDPQHPDYYLSLFSRIREERMNLDCIFESFGLPTVDFISSFKKTFSGPQSRIVLSPDVGSDRLRTIHKGHAYTNLTLVECLGLMKEHRVYCDLYFTMGLPFETKEDLCKTIRFQREIRRRFSNVRRISTFPVYLEPGSPMHLRPEDYGIVTSLREFVDFYQYHSANETPFSSSGYWIPNFFAGVNGQKDFDETLQKVKCRYLCSFHPDPGKSSSPSWGRRWCNLYNLFWRAKDRLSRKL